MKSPLTSSLRKQTLMIKKAIPYNTDKKIKFKHMKNLFIKALLIVSFIGCKAQNPIIDLSENDGSYEIYGAYYKDTNNLLNPFVGTYIYNDGSKMLKIVLQKKEMSFWYNHYEDLIIGEYQYIEDGVEKSNTLYKLDINYPNSRSHSIDGNLIMDGSTLCDDCLPHEKHLRGSVVETETRNSAEIDFKLTTVGGQPAIRVWLYWRYRTVVDGNPEPPQASFPGGEYIMLKQ